MAKNEIKITGEQLESAIDLCNDFDLFDFIFDAEDALLTEKEWDCYKEYADRLTVFISQNKGNKNAVFATSGQEDDVVNKLNTGVTKRSYEFKKVLTKKENRQFIKELAKILNPETNLNDLKDVMREVSGKIIFLKEAFQSM